MGLDFSTQASVRNSIPTVYRLCGRGFFRHKKRKARRSGLCGNDVQPDRLPFSANLPHPVHDPVADKGFKGAQRFR